MKYAIRFVCLVVAGFAFLTFTFSRADEVRDRSKAALHQDDPRQLRKPGADPFKGFSGPLGHNQEAPKGSSGPVGQEQPKAGTGPAVELPGKKKAPATKFVQIKRDKDGKPQYLQTAVVRYVPENGKGEVVVDLVSVVHIGDRQYYHKLNKLFEDYDVVLFELVMPKGAKVPKLGANKGSNNPISMLQDMMTLVLQLDLQTKCIDYTCTNFVHADLSPEELADLIQKRGDNALTLTLSIAADLLREQNKMQLNPNAGGAANLDPFKLLLDPQAPSKLKAIMAEQMEQMADGTGLGKTLNQLLIDDRNAACMKVFQQQLARGKKKIAIFYGAAHMPDFERRLIQDHGMKRQSVEWYNAWDLAPKQINALDLLKYLN